MNLLDKENIAEAIIEYINNSNNPALFAGAGVGIRAGSLSWKDFILYLADIANNYHSLFSELIRDRAKSGNFLEAAIESVSNQ